MTPVEPKFPGGMAVAPELAPGGGCAHSACMCEIGLGRTYCCQACARASEESDSCSCGHFGCTACPG